MKKRRISLIILLLLLSAVCLVSIGMAWKEYADRGKDKHAFEELAELIELPEETTVTAAETAVPGTEDGRQKLILSTCCGSAKSGRFLVIAEASE